jgi:DNA-binding SARP family transcriptional activator
MEETSQSPLTLRLLGEPRISYRDHALTAPLAGKEQALLIYLACAPGKRFSRDHLATLLWGETSQERARYNLRRALWHIREALDELALSPDDYVSTEDSWIWMPASAPCWVDTREFEAVLGTAFRHLRTEFSPSSVGVRRVRETIDLYRGKFLAAFSVSQAPGFDEWVRFERERLFQLLLRALSSLIQSFIAWGERDEAIDVCRRLLESDPIQEDTHRLLMRLYWDTGRRTQALRQYRRCREILSQELDVEPVEETQDLYQRILQNEISPTSISSLTLTSRLTLPKPAPETIARPRLFDLLDEGLHVPLTLVSAPPGYGKTTLAAQWVRHRSEQEETPETLFAWYRLSEADNAPFTLIEGLSTCLTRQHPALGNALREIYGLAAPRGDPRHATSLLIKALTSLETISMAIILDDAGLLTSSESQDALHFLLKHLPRTVHLYLLTRVDPDLPLGRMRIRGSLAEIRRRALRMTEEETERFLERARGPSLDDDEMEELTALAEGWAAPLWLAANARSRFAANLDDVWEALFAYLREEALAPQPVELGDFLLRTGILNRLTPTVCRALLSGNERHGRAAAWLTELRRRNLFLRRVEPAGRNGEAEYAYHPLFLRFLRTELPHHFSQAEIEALNRRAARAWKAYGDAEERLFHLQQAGSRATFTDDYGPPQAE